MLKEKKIKKQIYLLDQKFKLRDLLDPVGFPSLFMLFAFSHVLVFVPVGPGHRGTEGMVAACTLA